MNILFILFVALTGCVSLGYHQRKLREARGEPPIKIVNPDQEYQDFMNHKRPTEPTQ